MNTKELFKTLFAVAVLIVLSLGACFLLSLMVNNNYEITQVQFDASGPIIWGTPWVSVLIYIVWRLVIRGSLAEGSPKYGYPALLILTVVLSLAVSFFTTLIIFSFDTVAITSMIAALLLSTLLQTIGMLIASIVFAPH